MKKALLGVVLAVALAVSCHLPALAVPPMISYQGKLMQSSGAPIADGTYTMQFSIYDVPVGGTARWSETNQSVRAKGGLFSVLLGSVNPLPNDLFDTTERYFGIKVGSDPETTPRQKIASVAFSQVSQTVVNGAITTDKLANLAVTTDKIADGAITAAKFGSGVSGIPTGVIVMWSGSIASIPSGWALCDGNNGTPNLTSKFVIGATSTEPLVPGATGGADSVNLAHNHTANDHNHNANHSHGMDAAGNHGHHFDVRTANADGWYGYGTTVYPNAMQSIGHTHSIVGDTGGGGTHTHGISANNFNTGGSTDRGMSGALGNTSILPPYYALAFIMKLGS